MNPLPPWIPRNTDGLNGLISLGLSGGGGSSGYGSWRAPSVGGDTAYTSSEGGGGAYAQRGGINPQPEWQGGAQIDLNSPGYREWLRAYNGDPPNETWTSGFNGGYREQQNLNAMLNGTYNQHRMDTLMGGRGYEAWQPAFGGVNENWNVSVPSGGTGGGGSKAFWDWLKGVINSK